MSRFVTANRVMTAFITETDLHVSFISFRLAGIQEHGGIFVQCVASSWQHGKAKANMFEKMLKRTKKKKVPDLFCGLGEVVRKSASHRWRRQNRNKAGV